MIDWLVVWGVTQAAGVVVYPILETLAQDAAKDYGKDFFKDCLKKVIHLPEKDVQKEAYGKALRVFLELIQDELLEAGYQETLLKKYYIPALKKFIDREEVASTLGMAFNVECKAIDTALLVRVWTELNSPLLPEDMNWDFLSKSYIRAVKKIVQNSDKLRPIFEVQTLDKIADAVQEVAGIAPAFDLGKYAEGLREQYGNLKLESLDTTGVYYNELKLWKIFIPQNLRECQEFIPQVYELPKDRSRLLQESGQLDVLELPEAELENHRKRYVEQPVRGVFEVLGDPNELAKDGVAKYAVILGDPGSGKSTLLQYLALIWAERPVRDLPLYPLPLLLELRTYARDKQAGKCKDIVSFIHGGNITCRLNQQDLHEKLKNGDVIALFDGIDEVFDPALRDEVVTDIHRFTNEYPAVRSVATSRIFGYSQHKLRGAGFQHFMLQDLDDEQMQEFVVRWHDLNFTEGADKDRKRERLQKAIRESRSIKELAGNPLLLTMMAILNRNQELPRDRPELYSQASKVLLHQWDLENKLLEDPKLKDWKITIELEDKQAMLRKVAYYMQSSKRGLSGNLIAAIDLENILTEHLRTVLEKGEPRMVARLIIKQLRTRNFILCDLGGNSYGFVHRTFLEYFCAWEFVWQFKESQTLTIEQLIHDVFGNHWQDESWHEVLRLISGMIEPIFVAEIIDFLLEHKVDKSAFLDEFGRLKKEGVSNLLLAVDCFVEVRNRSLIAHISSKLLKILQCEVDQEYPYTFNSETAVKLISTISTTWQDRAEILDWLKKCLKFNSHSFIPDSAIQEIAKGWKDDSDTLPLLQDRALNDQNEYVRMAAVQEIAKGWKDDSGSLPLLQDRALNDQNEYIRSAAVQEIAKGWEDNSDTLPLLIDCALNDQHEYVRSAAVKEIAKGWKDDLQTFNFLCDRAIQDPFKRKVDWQINPRQTALEAILKHYSDKPQILELLKTVSNNDPDEQLKEFAKEELAKLSENPVGA
ncbi:NACHT domain-containing protein [Pseudanabaena sp. Chao 1811]|uniref:NACHT domain-containing protein n=1 Tax=Pseudanabaena sp. Chao 1811 TaxID=2963092 RepID=UPI0022F3AE0E|nr:HEAT repeat domain-containing protein [Pseudanabaena sp. Chao 1811]